MSRIVVEIKDFVFEIRNIFKWAMGLLGVVISLAPRNSGGFDALMVHQIKCGGRT